MTDAKFHFVVFTQDFHNIFLLSYNLKNVFNQVRVFIKTFVLLIHFILLILNAFHLSSVYQIYQKLFLLSMNFC